MRRPGTRARTAGRRRRRRPRPRTRPTPPPAPYATIRIPRRGPSTLHLVAGGAPSGQLTLIASGRQGRETLVDNVEFGGPALAAAESSPHRLLYATPELTAPVHLSGTARVTMRLASSKPAANLSVWLVRPAVDRGADRSSAT